MPENDPLIRRDNSRIKPIIATVEFPIFAILLSSSLTDAVISNLLLYRTCLVDLHYNERKCKLLFMINKTDEAKSLEAEVESKTTLLIMSISFIGRIMPAVLSLFVGPWSDLHGRKPLLMWPLLGQILTSFLVIVYSFLKTLSSWWFIICMLPFAIMGSSGSISELGMNLLITDITDSKERSFRLSILYGCGFLGVLIGSVSTSYIYECVGDTNLYALSTIIYIITYIYLWLCVEESVDIIAPGGLKDLFNIKLLKETYHVVFKWRPTEIIVMITLLSSAFAQSIFCISGMENMTYFFTRQKFQWLLKEYNIFSAVNTFIMVFGMFLGMAFLKKVYNMSDGVLLILSYTSSMADCIVRCFAKKSWHMYLAGSMSMLGALSPPLIRSQVAKIVPRNEISKMYSLITFIESIVPVFSPFVFNTIYYITLSTYPAAIYAVSSVFFANCLICAMIAEVVYYRTKNEDSLLKQDSL